MAVQRQENYEDRLHDLGIFSPRRQRMPGLLKKALEMVKGLPGGGSSSSPGTTTLIIPDPEYEKCLLAHRTGAQNVTAYDYNEATKGI